jgi:hypothetical protein
MFTLLIARHTKQDDVQLQQSLLLNDRPLGDRCTEVLARVNIETVMDAGINARQSGVGN